MNIKPFEKVQRIVLHGTVWEGARHLVLSFPTGAKPLHFLHRLKHAHWPTPSSARRPVVQVSLGFSRQGLERAHVPWHVLALFALKSPAFTAGAARRASMHLGATGDSAPSGWDPVFHFDRVDAVLSLHSLEAGPLDETAGAVTQLAAQCGVATKALDETHRLGPKRTGCKEAIQNVHFGFRDGLSRIGIEGFTKPDVWAELKPVSRFPAGEFLLGHPQHSGANPWIAGPRKKVWSEELRAFFADGSFGVMQQLEQHVAQFENFVSDKARELGMTPRELKSKLCGREPEGLPLAAEKGAINPTLDFDYRNDTKGVCCPFGSHIRRMNPRVDASAEPLSDEQKLHFLALAHEGRVRPLLRRGMPYGPSWDPDNPDAEPRGLLGQFFCASIEDQYEHLIGQWAERVPMGSADRGSARDPLIGAHEGGDGAFEIPRPGEQPSLRLKGLQAFTRTRGLAYLFYPSLSTLQGIADNSLWGLDREVDE